ncbi:DapH/DapD/GlmU-related protein [Demequina subtropica]|uniref:DapH/DapD/GlmU-related protein n=1 Tax=Demequina subtropica TaxID=1638989 RepID=UPI000AF55C2D|nr:DapH/DapD/GlmU-related protein [Demequina subtropica]
MRLVVNTECVIGAGAYIGKNATLVAFDNLTIGARTLIGENCSIHTEDHGPVGRRLDYRTAAVKIGDDVWIGAGAIILKGVEIGDGATIGAGAVVTRSIPAGATALGVPARVVSGHDVAAGHA